MILSNRMEAVVNMVSPQSFVIADIGCDHAYVSITLVERKLAQKVIAMDVRKGPLEIAKKNVTAYAMTDEIELRLSDGLDKILPGEADVIVINSGYFRKRKKNPGCRWKTPGVNFAATIRFGRSKDIFAGKCI